MTVSVLDICLAVGILLCLAALITWAWMLCLKITVSGS